MTVRVLMTAMAARLLAAMPAKARAARMQLQRTSPPTGEAAHQGRSWRPNIP